MDPEIQLQQAELDLKKQETERKALNDKFDYDLGLKRLEVDKLRLAVDANAKSTKIAVDKDRADRDRAARMTSDVIRTTSAAAKARQQQGKDKRKPE